MHGGDIYRNQVHMDFSVNVNPLGVPKGVAKTLRDGVSKVMAYPDPLCETLRSKLALHFESAGITADRILCGNGASELLLAICHAKKPTSALLMAPGFLGYRKALEAVNSAAYDFALREEDGFRFTRERFDALLQELFEKRKRPEIMFLANPSNPTGALIPKEWLSELAGQCDRTQTTLVIDECFLELTADPERHSMVGELLRHQNTWILRAFTKSFAVPGIRLGYLLCPSAEGAEEIARHLPEWNVSIPAQLAGIAALEDVQCLQEARDLIRREREFLAKGLEAAGAKVYPSDANFILFRWKNEALQKALLADGILIRDCRDYQGLGPGYFRVAVKTHAENEKLLLAIQACDNE